MNIWIVNHYATPPGVPGITRHFDFAKELTGRGHRVTIFASAFVHATRGNIGLRAWQQYRRETIDGIEFCWIRTPPYYGGNDWRRSVNMLSYSFSATLLGARFKPKPDVILASSPHPFAGLCGYALSRVRHAGFVFEVRDLWPQTLVDIGGYSPTSPVVRLLGLLERFLYRRADRIVVLLPGAADYMAPLGIPGDKIVHVPNGVNPRYYCDPAGELPGDIAALLARVKSGGRAVVAYAGAHGVVNALDTVVDAAALLQAKGANGAYFLMVGDGAEKRSLVRRAEELGLDNISFFSSIPKEAIPRLLDEVDVGVIAWRKSPLYRYGVSANKLWDYMMSARPIVWAIDTPCDPVAEAGCGITVRPEGPASLADAISLMCNMSEKERQEMGSRGREYVLQHNSTPMLAGRLLQVLQEARGE